MTQTPGQLQTAQHASLKTHPHGIMVLLQAVQVGESKKIGRPVS